MKHRMQWELGVLAATLLLAIAGARTQAEPLAPTNTPPTASEFKPDAEPASMAEAAPADTDAPARLVSSEKPLPPTIRPSSPVAEVIKLANSGLDETVMLAFITNSAHTFNLGAEEIIYLNDIGVPGAVVTAMIQRDEVLKEQLAAAANSTPSNDAVMVETANTEPAPLVDNSAPPGPDPSSYPVEAPLTPPEVGEDAMFYDSLAPYGSWVDVAGYGRCWQPTAVVVNPGWQPYFDCGRWVYSDCGWYWLSDYSWGWAPFHYGRWFHHGRLGWCWLPGRTWGPSWVSWRYNDHYCGWAPLPPGAHFAAGVGLTFHGHAVHDGDDFGLRPGHYRFVAWNHFHDRALRPGSLPRNENDRVFGRTTVATRINGDGQTVINNGLPVSRVAAATHRPVQTVTLQGRTAAEPGAGRAERFEAGGHSLQVYRPDPTLATRPAWGVARSGAGATSSGWNSQPATQVAPPTRASYERPSSLVLRGAQPSGLREKAPANSLVVIGRGQNSAGSAMPARPAASAAAAQPVPSADNRPPVPSPDRNWMGTVTSSPRPTWFTTAENPGGNRVNPNPAASPRPEVRTYQPAQRAQPAAPVAVPRYAPSYTPTPSYGGSRSYSPPAVSAAPSRAPSYESRPAPSAPSAPSAPAASSRGSSSQPSGRNGR